MVARAALNTLGHCWTLTRAIDQTFDSEKVVIFAFIAGKRSLFSLAKPEDIIMSSILCSNARAPERKNIYLSEIQKAHADSNP